MKIPAIGSKWRHHKGGIYTVVIVSNECSTDKDKFPVTIIYQGDNGKVWSAGLLPFTISMRPMVPPTARSLITVTGQARRMA